MDRKEGQQIVSLSGGRDSTCMLLMMLEREEQIDDIVFFDWGKEYPELYRHLEKLEAYIARPITRISALYTWEFYQYEHVHIRGKRVGQKGMGFPTFGNMWCKGRKIDAFDKYCQRATQCVGITFEERRRAKYNRRRRYPLLEWGVTAVEGYKYCLAHGFEWGGLYEIYHRVSCSCCPFVRRLT